MAYAAWSVIAGEQPTTSKWNILGSNDSSFNDGSGFGSGSVATAAYATKSVTPPKLNTPAVSLSYFFNPAFTGTSASAAAITGMSQAITTLGGGLEVFYCLPLKVSTNTATIYLYVDGASKTSFQTSTLTTLYIPNMFKVDTLAAGSHTVALYYSIPGGATLTCQQYESGVLTLFELGNT